MPNRKSFSVKIIAKVTVFSIKAAIFHVITKRCYLTLAYYNIKDIRMQVSERKNIGKYAKNFRHFYRFLPARLDNPAFCGVYCS